MSWQPIETAPKDGSWILAALNPESYSRNDSQRFVVVTWLQHRNDERSGSWIDDEYSYDVTHWMPLPEPPK